MRSFDASPYLVASTFRRYSRWRRDALAVLNKVENRSRRTNRNFYEFTVKNSETWADAGSNMIKVWESKLKANVSSRSTG